MIDFTATYTDQYQLAMAQVYFLRGPEKRTAVFDYFFRKLPFEGGYALLSGLEDLIDIVEGLRFDERDLNYLKDQNFDSRFIDFLSDFRFTGNIYSHREGDLVFPTAPVLQVEADILEAQILETLVLNTLNYQTLIATKASRMHQVARGKRLIEFGLRRAQGPGGYYASRAAVMGGFVGTSNVRAARDFDIPASGTMAHSFVQLYDDELTAFREFAAARPEACVLLVDTYDTLKSGVPNAIKVGLEMMENGQQLLGIRLDSGDLAYLARKSREMLDDAGLEEVQIVASNQLDEYVIKSLLEQGAPIDVFGVGTSVAVGKPDAALDGVYKLAFADGKPRIKLSENKSKVSLPGRKQVYRLRDSAKNLIGADVISLRDESAVDYMYHPFDSSKHMSVKACAKEAMLQPVMEDGKRSQKRQSITDIKDFSVQRLAELPPEYKRFDNPHIYKIGLSEKLNNQREELLIQLKK